MKKGYLLTLMAMVVAIGCNAQDEMIDRRTVTDFDLKRYMGRWYELARYDHRFERNMVQCEAFYTLHPDGKVEVRNTGLDTTTGKPHTSIGKAKAGKHTGQLRVSFFLFFYNIYTFNSILFKENHRFFINHFTCYNNRYRRWTGYCWRTTYPTKCVFYNYCFLFCKHCFSY